MNNDIEPNNWLLRRIPKRYQAYAILARLDRPIGIWLLLLPSLWGIGLAGLSTDISLFAALSLPLLFAIGAVVMRAAGCIINDLWDRKIDSEVARTKCRPLASGQLSLEQAVIFLFMLLMAGLIVLLLLSSTTIALGLLVIPLIIIYPFMKRLTYWPQAFLGVTFNFGALMGWAAVTNSLGAPAYLLYGAAILWTLGYDTIYAQQDREDDALIGVKSTALLFGEDSKRWVAGFYAASWIFLALAFLAAGASIIALLTLILAGAHFFWQIKIWDLNDPDSALRVFKSNRDYGLIVLAAILIAEVLG